MNEKTLWISLFLWISVTEWKWTETMLSGWKTIIYTFVQTRRSHYSRVFFIYSHCVWSFVTRYSRSCPSVHPSVSLGVQWRWCNPGSSDVCLLRRVLILFPGHPEVLRHSLARWDTVGKKEKKIPPACPRSAPMPPVRWEMSRIDRRGGVQRRAYQKP